MSKTIFYHTSDPIVSTSQGNCPQIFQIIFFIIIFPFYQSIPITIKYTILLYYHLKKKLSLLHHLSRSSLNSFSFAATCLQTVVLFQFASCFSICIRSYRAPRQACSFIIITKMAFKMPPMTS